MDAQLVLTGDGSTSIFIPDLDEHYHSVHGALQESKHVFIEAGLQPFLYQQRSLHVLEIGFGTGLNALLTCLSAGQTSTDIHYTTVEKYPLNSGFIKSLNYCTLLQESTCENLFEELHNCSWEDFQNITSCFKLKKCRMDIGHIEWLNTFDLIYFDAFAPSAQPELWTEQIFSSMHNALKEKGVLVTYCAKGIVKRTMKSVGFFVEALPGPPGKREMTRATKIHA